jgi:bacitracin transport system permease protein
MRELLSLISCKLAKRKRKKFISLVLLSGFLFPLVLMMLTPRMMAQYDTKAELFDGFCQLVPGCGVELLPPGVIAAMLLFTERDNNTFKNLRTIPVTGTRMIFAKITVLFLFGLIFCLPSAAVTILCGSLTAGAGGLGCKLWLAVEPGCSSRRAPCPWWCWRSFSARPISFRLRCIFCGVLSQTAGSCCEVMPGLLCRLMLFPSQTSGAPEIWPFTEPGRAWAG